MYAQEINFDQINSIWSSKLWPNRESAIEPMSAMTWPFEGSPPPYDITIFEKYKPTFWGIFVNGNLIGVNSGHRTTDRQYRSRGIWVDPEYRKYGYSQHLFYLTEQQAVKEGCEVLWSIPRKTALKAYEKFGFNTVGDFFATETSDSNVYVIKNFA